MSVTSKKWRLSVTPLSSTSPVHQLEVEAVNWMGALRAARRELGEDGGLPTGASCAVAPDGTVTILDSESRRKFLLTPGAVIARNAPSGALGDAGRTPEKRRSDTLGYGDEVLREAAARSRYVSGLSSMGSSSRVKSSSNSRRSLGFGCVRAAASRWTPSP